MEVAIRDLAIEVVEEDELETLIARAAAARDSGGDRPKAYIGFEPSGTAHVGWIVCTDMIRRLYEGGFDVTILLADWHAQINDKLGGDLHTIRRCAEYMTDAFESLGVEKGRVTYRFAADFARDDRYWARVIQVAKHTTLARMRRAMDIMGRSAEDGDRDVSKFLYPAMQVADMFHMNIDLAYGGLDQRHAHMLARDVARKLSLKAPVAIHTPLVPSLRGDGRMDPADPSSKMSKSDPDSGIFLHDDTEAVARKIKRAHCPAKRVDENPVLDLLRLVIWPRSVTIDVPRDEQYGGPLSYSNHEDLVADFASGTLHPQDLKTAVAAALEKILEPVRVYFSDHPENLRFVEGLRRVR